MNLEKQCAAVPGFFKDGTMRKAPGSQLRSHDAIICSDWRSKQRVAPLCPKQPKKHVGTRTTTLRHPLWKCFLKHGMCPKSPDLKHDAWPSRIIAAAQQMLLFWIWTSRPGGWWSPWSRFPHDKGPKTPVLKGCVLGADPWVASSKTSAWPESMKDDSPCSPI